MSAPIPSGFKTREEYNDYMQKYNKSYRERKKANEAEISQLLSKLGTTADFTGDLIDFATKYGNCEIYISDGKLIAVNSKGEHAVLAMKVENLREVARLFRKQVKEKPKSEQ